ncbi:MAG: NAD(P)H-dependent oxidoreductase [Alphaproteobacteria bacterium]|nr:NAD(P)H-dependent oxidoreductase [Alphaproteobacteria bacterium]
MSRRILVILGHPDPAPGHFDRALAEAYQTGAEAAGHEVARIDIADLDIPVLRSAKTFETETPSGPILAAQQAIERAEHLMIVYPLWLGTLPGLLKLFFEQVFRPGFAFDYKSDGFPKPRLAGRSARIVVTMGMPAFLYRYYYFAHSLRSLKRHVLGFVGIGPIRDTVIGSVEAIGDAGRARWLEKLETLGRKGA